MKTLVVDRPNNIALTSNEVDDAGGVGINEDIFNIAIIDAAGNSRAFVNATDVVVFTEPNGNCQQPFASVVADAGVWNANCSDVICFVNQRNLAGVLQGNIWVVSDTPNSDDIKLLPAACLTTPASANLTEDPVGGLAGSFTRQVSPVAALGVPVNLTLTLNSDTRILGSTVSDSLVVATPAAPPAAYGLLALGLFIGVGFFVKRKDGARFAS